MTHLDDRRPVGLFCGLAVVDVIQLVADPPGPDDKVTALDQVVAAGGPATNAAVTFAALGGRAVLAVPVGRGPLAALVREDLASCGVELLDCAATDEAETAGSAAQTRPAVPAGQTRPAVPAGQTRPAGPAGQTRPAGPAGQTRPAGLSVSSCTVWARTGQRSVVSTNARQAVDPAPLHHLAQEVAAGRAPAPDVVLVDGHNPALARTGLDLAEATDAIRLMDAGSWKDAAADLLPRCDVVAASARFYPPGVLPRPEDVAAWLLGLGVPGVVVTRGGEDALWWQADGMAPQCRGAVRPPEVAVVDTLGAGDVFHGALAHALAHALARHQGLPGAVATACDVAAASATTLGTRAWLGRVAPQA